MSVGDLICGDKILGLIVGKFNGKYAISSSIETMWQGRYNVFKIFKL